MYVLIVHQLGRKNIQSYLILGKVTTKIEDVILLFVSSLHRMGPSLLCGNGFLPKTHL